MHVLNGVDIIIMVLLIIGGINWGLIGLFRFDLIAAVFGVLSPIARIVYCLVGFSAVYTLYLLYKLTM